MWPLTVVKVWIRLLVMSSRKSSATKLPRHKEKIFKSSPLGVFVSSWQKCPFIYKNIYKAENIKIQSILQLESSLQAY